MNKPSLTGSTKTYRPLNLIEKFLQTYWSTKPSIFTMEGSPISCLNKRLVLLFLLQSKPPFPIRPNECRNYILTSKNFKFKGVHTVTGRRKRRRCTWTEVWWEYPEPPFLLVTSVLRVRWTTRYSLFDRFS